MKNGTSRILGAIIITLVLISYITRGHIDLLSEIAAWLAIACGIIGGSVLVYKKRRS